jgi:hypothetical protein
MIAPARGASHVRPREGLRTQLYNRTVARVFLALVLAGLCSSILAAQSTTGSISGRIADESKGILPGASLVATHLETGRQRMQTSDAEGRYRLLDLPPGTYRLTATLDRFRTSAREGLILGVGQNVQADLTLELGTVTEEVVVNAAVTDVEFGTTAVGGRVTSRQIEQLPLNGRSYLQLATLQPGVVISRGTPRDFGGGFGTTQLSVAGARPEQMGFLLDGTNIADISDKAPSSVAGVMLGVDTVQEFSVQTHGYSAEFGRASGGIVSAVTKAGTNTLRGSAFLFYRDNALDSRNFFDSGDLPEFRRHQAGATLGGPIVKNRLFFFGSYEGLRDRRAVTRYARLPNADAHRGLLPGANGQFQNVGVHPLVQPYLQLLFPVPGGRDFGDGTAEAAHAHLDPTDENFGVVKLDWNAGAADSFLVRYTRDASSAQVSQEHPLFREDSRTDTRYLTAQHQRVFSANTLNSLRGAANRTFRDSDVVPLVDVPTSLYFTEDPHWGAINIVGISLAGSTGTIPVRYTQDLYQLLDTVTWHRGRHTWKSGADWQLYDFDGFSNSRYGGEFRFRNLGEFLTLRRSGTAQADRFTGSLPGSDTLRHVRQQYLATFVQDDWRVSNTLSVTLGVRWEFVTDPNELNGKLAGLLSFDDLESGPRGVTPGTPLFDNPSKRSIAPRLGASWAPSGTSATTVRGGWGLFHQPLTVSFYRGTLFRVYPYYAGVDIRQPAVFGPGNIAVLAGGAGSQGVQKRSEFVAYDTNQPYTHQWHGTVQRDLGRGLVAEAGYLGSKGVNLPFYGDPNAVPAEYTADGTKRLVPGATLRFPSWGRIRTRANVARSIYHGVTLGVTKRTAAAHVQGSYTYGNARDNWSGGLLGNSDFDNGTGSATDFFDPEYEFGPSNFDVRHNLTVNVVYQLPWGETASGARGALTRGWQVSGLMQLSSGIPFTPYVGFDRAGDLQSDTLQQKANVIGPVRYPHRVDQWFDPASFALPAPGIFGNAGRNSLRAPGVKVADLAVYKNVRTGWGVMQVRLEAFNAFNWVNLGLPSAGVLFNTDGTPFAGAGRITSTSTPARQVQLGVRLNF